MQRQIPEPTNWFNSHNNHQLVEANMFKLRYVELFKLVAQVRVSWQGYLPNAREESANGPASFYTSAHKFKHAIGTCHDQINGQSVLMDVLILRLGNWSTA